MSSETLQFADSHLHLQDPPFEADLGAVVLRARSAGVRLLVCNGSCERDWPRVAAIARAYPEVVPCFGVHPWYVGERSAAWLAALREALGRQPAGVGEIGLDRWIKDRDEAAQEQVFRAQLAVARELDRPVMIHCLRAWGWFMRVLDGEAPLPAGMLIHAYSGAPDLIEPLVERGAYISFAGNVLKGRSARARASLQAVPLERLLLETDAPDMLPPEPFRSAGAAEDRNEPAHLPAILRGVAELRGEREDQLAGIVWENSRRFLGRLAPVNE